MVEYRPVSDEELLLVRQKNLHNTVTDAVAELTRYMISEHFAAYFFLRTSRLAKEPVLGQICGHISRDEFRHAQFAFDLLESRVRAGTDSQERCLNAGLHFRHVGSDVVTAVPISQKNDLQAILTLDQKMHRLCGVGLSEFAKARMHDLAQ